MKTLILPGFSIKNNKWAQECAQNLKDFDIQIVKWKHWISGDPSDFSVEHEAKSILTGYPEQVNVIAKSVGTLTLAHFLSNGGVINKLVLCGIPFFDIDEKDQKEYKILSTLPSGNMIIFQNEFDPHGSYIEVKRFIEKIGLNVELVKKSADDHNYPYYQEFEQFLRK